MKARRPKTKRMVPLLYVGRRVINDKIRQCFLEGAKEHYWTGIKYVTVGHIYESTRTKEGHSIMVKPQDFGADPEFSKEMQKESDRQELIVQAFIARRRSSGRVKKRINKIRDEFILLKQQVNGLTYIETKYFIEHLIDKLQNRRQKL